MALAGGGVGGAAGGVPALPALLCVRSLRPCGCSFFGFLIIVFLLGFDYGFFAVWFLGCLFYLSGQVPLPAVALRLFLILRPGS